MSLNKSALQTSVSSSVVCIWGLEYLLANYLGRYCVGKALAHPKCQKSGSCYQCQHYYHLCLLSLYLFLRCLFLIIIITSLIILPFLFSFSSSLSLINYWRYVTKPSSWGSWISSLIPGLSFNHFGPRKGYHHTFFSSLFYLDWALWVFHF